MKKTAADSAFRAQPLYQFANTIGRFIAYDVMSDNKVIYYVLKYSVSVLYIFVTILWGVIAKNVHILAKISILQNYFTSKNWYCSPKLRISWALTACCMHTFANGPSYFKNAWSECKFWPLDVLLHRFKSECLMSVCYSKCVPAFLSAYKCAWLWINEFEQHCLVCDKISVSCSQVWQSSPGLWVLLSAPISLPNTAPSLRRGHSLTFETSAVGCLIPRDMPCSLPHSISIAAQTPPILLACIDR